MQRIEIDNDMLVSVGIPVRNGGKLLRLALDSVLNQTHKNLEIIISNNDSTDSTEEICLEAASKDPRIKYFKQEKLIPSIDNFRFVFEQSCGKYFMWAAHDDLRSINYIEVLLVGFHKYPESSIIFSDVKLIDDEALIFDSDGRGKSIDYSKYQSLPRPDPVFNINDSTFHAPSDTRSMDFYEKNLRQAKSMCTEIYGLINVKNLKEYPWYSINFGADVPILYWLMYLGDFVYLEGAQFYYYIGVTTVRESSTYSKSTIGDYHLIRLSWVCAKAVVNACHLDAFSIKGFSLLLKSFYIIYLSRHGGLLNFLFKGVIYTRLPLPIKSIWRKLKGLWSPPVKSVTE